MAAAPELTSRIAELEARTVALRDSL